MIRAAVLAATLCAALPAAAAEVRAAAAVTIFDPAVLQLAFPTALPSVVGTDTGARFAGRMPSLGISTMLPANARLVILRQDDTGLTVTAPAGFEVVSAGPGRGYIVRTTYSPDALQALDGLIVGGTLPGSAAASIDVGRSPAIAPMGGLAVVVQYN
jgi:hypothetical protein